MAVKFKDYYQTLGVARTATADEIKKAFRKLAAKFHPDVNKEAGAEARFKEINEAYEVLRDPEKRKLYDQLGPNWKAGQEFTPPPGWESFGQGRRRAPQPGGFDGHVEFEDFGDFSDFFSSLFGGMGGMGGGGRGFGGRTARARRGEDQEVELPLTLEEVLRGGKKAIELQTQSLGPDGQPRVTTQRYDVTIPTGVHDGTRIRLAGQGAQGAGGAPAGDLHLRVRLLPHPQFEARDGDLRTVVQITPWEAALGGEITLPTLTGSLTLKVPPGSQSGQTLRLRGQGLPRDGGRGDLLATLRIVLPERLSDRERELLDEWRRTSGYAPPERLRHP